MIRFLFLILLGFIIWGIFRIVIRVSQLLGLFSSATQATPPPKTLSEKLVECAFCHTFIPKDHAVQQKNVYYCCEEHALRK